MRILLILAFIFTSNVYAVNSGDLDTSFSNDGTTDGWTFYGPLETGNNVYEANDLLLDDQGRFYTVMWHEDNNFDNHLYVLRFLADGTLDSNYANSGVSDDITQISGTQNFLQSFIYKPKLAFDADGGIFVGYTLDINYSYPKIFHLDSSGVKIGEIKIEHSGGATYANAVNGFKDFVFIESQSKLAIASTLDLSNTDTDFGVALVNVNNTTGALSLDTNFSTDGLESCYFDHDVSFKKDIPHAILWDEVNQRIIVAGEAHEGNGDHSDGANAAFCEFDLFGDLKQQWSTQVIPPSVSTIYEFSRNVEKAQDIALHNGELIVIGEIYKDSSQFGVFKYERDFFTGIWVRVVDFGKPGFTGWGLGTNLVNSTGDNFPQNLVVESDGKILVVGYTQTNSANYMGLVKFTATGKQDINWGSRGDGSYVKQSFNGTGDGKTLGYAVVEDLISGAISVTGTSLDENGKSKMFLAKFHNDLIFKSGFE